MGRNEPAFRQKIVQRFRIENCVRIAGIAERIRKQAADSKLFVRRPANIRDCSAISILIVGARVVGVDPAGADRIIKLVDLALAFQPFPKGIVGPAFTAQHDCRRSIALFREDLNDAGKRPWPIQGALRTPHDFDPVDVVRHQIGEIKRSLQTLINRNAVEQDLCMLAT